MTKEFGVINAKKFEEMIEKSSLTSASESYYVMMGRSLAWPNTSNPTLLDDTTLPKPIDSYNDKIEALKNGFFLKRVNGSDLQAVIPRIDWVQNQVYVPYDQTTDLFARTIETRIASGNVNVSIALANTVNANGINFNASTPSVFPGALIKIGEEVREVVRVNTSGDYLQVNTNFTKVYSTENIFRVTTSSLGYLNKFYVRNTFDQVFKCLFNNNNNISFVMPTTSVSGQLPSNPYITTSDGYKWKYMYTIPAGLKQRFFTSEFMPVVDEKIVTDSAVDGRIDIVQILSGGSGYFEGKSTTNYSATSNVVNVIGDGTGAKLTADITDGVITKINILNPGSGYTYAAITVTDPLISPINTAASLRAVVGPSGGHGSSAEYELGASYRMLSVDFTGNLSGFAPTATGGIYDFRQISLVRNPELLSNGSIAFNTTGFNMCTKIALVDVVSSFTPDGIVYVGASYETSTFSGRVVFYDTTLKILYVNAIVGNSTQDFLQNKTIFQKDTGIQGKVFEVTQPDINTLSGQVLRIENRAKITRNPDQTESTRILLSF